ncbi:MAG TPA: bifunctional precorrin-2 dehydrogenase/sirohydrochlorin ferrochelatase [Acidimicrobiales bacterium]|nr:bifunctional precorrin-2 dehydrogenase/sirohydrochlorin ferrochelatase [Acidimicrobiales bacterium]
MPVEGPQYPVNLTVAGRRCLVVGGGRVARRKVEGLRDAGAAVHVVAPDIDPDLAALDGVTSERRPYRRGEAGGYRLVVAATGDPAVNQAVYDDGEAAGVWVNSADDPDRCSFTLPAVLRRGPVTVTVATGGHSPALASWLRDRIGDWLGPEYETLVGVLAAERDAIRAEGRSTEGLAWHLALDSDMLALIRQGRITEARERLKACLSSS